MCECVRGEREGRGEGEGGENVLCSNVVFRMHTHGQHC